MLRKHVKKDALNKAVAAAKPSDRDERHQPPPVTIACISAKNCSSHVNFFFIASPRPGMAGCFGFGRAPRKHRPSLSDHTGNGRFFRRSFRTFPAAVDAFDETVLYRFALRVILPFTAVLGTTCGIT